MKHHEMIISGGGMVGCALACGLGQAGFDVALIEHTKQPPLKQTHDIDLRVSAITRASQHLLMHLGAWDIMQAIRVSPYKKMQVWDAQGPGKITFDAHDIAEPNLGHIIENRVILDALWQQLKQTDKVSIYSPDHIERYDTVENNLKLTNQTLHAPLIVSAEGATSPLRNMANIAVSGWQYHQTAIVCTIKTDMHHQQTAYQRFMPNGPIAFLPIDDGRCSIVWSTSNEQARELLALNPADFCQALGHASDHVLGKVTHCSSTNSFPLSLKNADHYIKPGFALVGDAAHSVHPLAGQGVNLGFMDVAELIDLLVDGRKKQHPLGSLGLLRKYERARRSEDMIMLGTMDIFNRLFSNQHRPLAFIRNIGLELANHALPLKKQMMWQALGVSEQTPSLTKPPI